MTQFINIKKHLTDEGHKNLLIDLHNLLAEASAGEFHDFASQRATPKMDLRSKLLTLANNVIAGNYDNSSK